MSPTPLPEGLSASFRVRDALDAGVTRGRLRSHDLVRPHHGVRSTSPSASVATAARELATAMKGREVAFSHVTAARLLGMPVPTEWTPDEPLHVMTTANGRVRRPGVAAARGLERRSTCLVHGLLVTDPLSTWCDLAAGHDVDALVVAGDWLLRPGSDLTRDDLAQVIPSRARRGMTLRQAMRWIRPGSASPQETRTRLLLVRDGLPEPRLNADLVTGQGWVATVDLYWEEWRLALDYDGRHHRERARQLDYDLDRARLIRSAGFRFEQVTAKHVAGVNPQVLGIVREQLLDAGWRAATRSR